MGRRAERTAATEQRLLEAAEKLFFALPYTQVRLEDIAREAGASAATIVHRYGSKEGLVAAVARAGAERVLEQRNRAVPGDIPGIVRNLAEHYEEWGDRILHLLAQEAGVPAIRAVTDSGRILHADWVGRNFERWLAPTTGTVRRRLLAELVAVTDVYLWRILRRDRGLSQAETRAAMLDLVSALLESAR